MFMWISYTYSEIIVLSFKLIWNTRVEVLSFVLRWDDNILRKGYVTKA